MNTLSHIFISLLCSVPVKNVLGQKLPDKQLTNVNIPTNYVVDGRSNEWNGVYKAYNHNTNIYYTIANNNNSIYLIAATKDPVVIKKIIGGGLTFTVNKDAHRNSDHNFSLTYPIISPKNQSSLVQKISEKNTINSSKVDKIDSITLAINKIIDLYCKEIKIKGSNQITDSLVSVYNRLNVHVKLQIDKSGLLIFECCFSNKNIFSNNLPEKMVYNIMINGINSIVRTAVTNDSRVVSVEAVPRGLTNSALGLEAIRYPTDFWGEYNFR